jgi:uncharacterized membrane protein
LNYHKVKIVIGLIGYFTFLSLPERILKKSAWQTYILGKNILYIQNVHSAFGFLYLRSPTIFLMKKIICLLSVWMSSMVAFSQLLSPTEQKIAAQVAKNHAANLKLVEGNR